MSTAPPYLGIDLLFLLLLEGDVKLWLVYLDTRETGEKGVVWRKERTGVGRWGLCHGRQPQEME